MSGVEVDLLNNRCKKCPALLHVSMYVHCHGHITESGYPLESMGQVHTQWISIGCALNPLGLQLKNGRVIVKFEVSCVKLLKAIETL
jgi:hypothetical protein